MDKKLEARIAILEKMVKENFDIDPAKTASVVADHLANAAFQASMLVEDLKFLDDKALLNKWMNVLDDIRDLRNQTRRLADSMA